MLTIELDRALEILAQPKATRGRKAATPIHAIGKHPVDEEPINVYDGPYGPYIKHGKVNVSVPEGKKPEEVTLEEAVALLKEKGGEVKKKKTTKKKATTKKSTAKKSTAKKSTAKKSTTKKATTTKKTTKSTDTKAKSTTAKKTTKTAAAKKTAKASATEKVEPETAETA